jgi:hypothetical protein
MNNRLVNEGEIRLILGQESELWKTIEAKYAAELASASWLKGVSLKFQKQREFHRRKKELHKPSPGTLW